MLSNNEKMPKVSIIVPVYKTKDTLTTCMESLLTQTLREIEIILVDDGSPDESGCICDTYLQDKRVKVIHKENGGLASARNAGLKLATGKYVGFVDSDDYVDNTMFEKMYMKITETGSDVCLCAHYTVGEGNQEQEHYLKDIPDILDQKEIVQYLILPLVGPDIKNSRSEIEGFVWRNLYRREIVLLEKFQSEREFFAEDVVFNLNVYKKCRKICTLNECLYYYKYNESSLSNKYRHGVERLLDNLLLWEKEYLITNNLQAEGFCRLYATGIKFIIFSIKNLKKNNCPLNHKEKKKEIKRLLAQKMFSESLQSSKGYFYNWKMRMFLLLCKTKQSDLLLRLL